MWVPAMVTVRTGSTRLPQKCMLEFSSTRSVLTHVILRCLEFHLRPIIATTMLPEDDLVWMTANEMGVACHRGPTTDKMRRWLDAARGLKVERFVVVDCDDPFFDPGLTRSMYELTECSDVALPDMRAYLGSHGIAMRVDMLEKSVEANEAAGIINTEMVWKYIHEDANIIKAHIKDVDPVEHDLRLTLDYPEDYWLIRSISRMLGPVCQRTDIIELFKRNPELRLINDFRNVAWKQGQELG